jgi:hypothetical protein
MRSDHPKFRARLQTISMLHVRDCDHQAIELAEQALIDQKDRNSGSNTG